MQLLKFAVAPVILGGLIAAVSLLLQLSTVGTILLALVVGLPYLFMGARRDMERLDK